MTSLEPLDELLPKIEPAGWTIFHREPGGLLARRFCGLQIILTACRETDGKRWYHLSALRHNKFTSQNQLPTWEDLKMVKDVWIGPDYLAVQVLPRRKDFVNLNPNVLHLWCCLDGDPIPDFKAARGGLI